MSPASNHRELWGQALGQRSVWPRALKLGFTQVLVSAAQTWVHRSIEQSTP